MGELADLALSTVAHAVPDDDADRAASLPLAAALTGAPLICVAAASCGTPGESHLPVGPTHEVGGPGSTSKTKACLLAPH